MKFGGKKICRKEIDNMEYSSYTKKGQVDVHV
jgi:hypothetical protein